MGNMRFIGQLLVNRILAAKILPPIAEMLLNQHTDISIECLCTLGTVVGPVFTDWGKSFFLPPLLNN